MSFSHVSDNLEYCWLEIEVQLLWDALCLVLHPKPSFSDFIKHLLANVERCLVNLLPHLNECCIKTEDKEKKQLTNLL